VDLSTRHRFHIAPGYDPADPDSWVWEDRSADVDHVDGGVSIRGGRGDEVSQVDAGYGALRLDNAGGHYCTRNPLGRWYGRLARNTPARWGVIVGAEAFATNATNGWGTPDIGTSWTLGGTASDWSVSSGVGQKVIATANSAQVALLNGANARDGEATFVCFSSVIATGGPLIYGLIARHVDNSNFLMFNVELSTSGSISAKIRRVSGGVFTELAVNEPLAFTYTTNQRIKARCQWDGPALRLKVWQEASAEPAAWTVITSDNVMTGSQSGIFVWRFVANTNAGSLTFFVDDVEIEAVELVGTVPEWPVRWDPTARVSWAPIQIAGITRQLNQGQQALRSPIYRQLIAQPTAAYWPLEDESAATAASSALPRGVVAAVTDVSFGSGDCPPGAASAVALNSVATSQVYGQVSDWPVPQNGYAAMLYFRVPSLPGSAKALFELRAVGTVTRWVIAVGAATFSIDGFDRDGNSVVSALSSVYVVDITKWTALDFETEEVGGTVNWSIIWTTAGVDDYWVTTGSYSGTADRLVWFKATAPVDGTLISHVWLGDDLLPFVDTTFIRVSAGYSGELAADRVARLCTEEGVLCAVEAGASEPLGPQRIGTLLDLLHSAEAADLGVLYEHGAGLGYRPRYARYNRPVDMVLAIAAAGDIADPAPEPTDDDLRVRNEWTLTRDGGGQATDSDLVHIALNGRYPDSATINVQTDARLAEHASWRVHLGTWGDMRWPSVTLNLTDRPDLLALWLGRPFGPRITISGVPTQGPIGFVADLIVEGWTQEITSASWTVTLNCSPAGPWDVGIYSTSRYDSETTTLASGITSTATSVPITSSDVAGIWSTTGVPYTWAVSGEVMTVTAMTAASGTGPYTQTATVTRSDNGIVKAQVAGESVHLAARTYYAL
jgi:hypothetical protein